MVQLQLTLINFHQMQWLFFWSWTYMCIFCIAQTMPFLWGAFLKCGKHNLQHLYSNSLFGVGSLVYLRRLQIKSEIFQKQPFDVVYTFVGFLEVLERKAQGHPFENVPSLLPSSPWLGPYPPPGELIDCISLVLERKWGCTEYDKIFHLCSTQTRCCSSWRCIDSTIWIRDHRHAKRLEWRATVLPGVSTEDLTRQVWSFCCGSFFSLT